jgi:hypothetical protein
VIRCAVGSAQEPVGNSDSPTCMAIANGEIFAFVPGSLWVVRTDAVSEYILREEVALSQPLAVWHFDVARSRQRSFFDKRFDKRFDKTRV